MKRHTGTPNNRISALSEADISIDNILIMNQFTPGNELKFVNKVNSENTCSNDCPSNNVCGFKVGNSCPPGFTNNGFCCMGNRNMVFLSSFMAIVRGSLKTEDRNKMVKFTKGLNINTGFDWDYLTEKEDERRVSLSGITIPDCIELIKLARKIDSLVKFRVNTTQFIEIVNGLKDHNLLIRPSYLGKDYYITTSNHYNKELSSVIDLLASEEDQSYFNGFMKKLVSELKFLPGSPNAESTSLSIPLVEQYENMVNFDVFNKVSWNVSGWDGSHIPELFNVGTVNCVLDDVRTSGEQNNSMIRNVLENFISFLQSPQTDKSMTRLYFNIKLDDITNNSFRNVFSNLLVIIEKELKNYNGNLRDFSVRLGEQDEDIEEDEVKIGNYDISYYSNGFDLRPVDEDEEIEDM